MQLLFFSLRRRVGMDLTGFASRGYRKYRVKLACVRPFLLFPSKRRLRGEKSPESGRVIRNPRRSNRSLCFGLKRRSNRAFASFRQRAQPGAGSAARKICGDAATALLCYFLFFRCSLRCCRRISAACRASACHSSISSRVIRRGMKPRTKPPLPRRCR